MSNPELVELLKSCRFDPDATSGYDILAGGLVWDDELPPDATEGDAIRAQIMLREVIAYRASLSLGAPRTDLAGHWLDLQRHAPTWPGFRDERIHGKALRLLRVHRNKEARILRDDLEKALGETDESSNENAGSTQPRFLARNESGDSSVRPPLTLLMVAIGYLALEVWTLVRTPEATVAVRLGLSIALFYFVLRGSRVAGYLLAALCAGAALLCIYGFVSFPLPVSIGFGLAGLVCAAIAGYVVLSPEVRVFQASRERKMGSEWSDPGSSDNGPKEHTLGD